jgi:hypothetical protein
MGIIIASRINKRIVRNLAKNHIAGKKCPSMKITTPNMMIPKIKPTFAFMGRTYTAFGFLTTYIYFIFIYF